MLHKDYNRKGSVEKKILVVALKGLVAKTKWLAAKQVTLTLNESEQLSRVEAGSNTSTVALRVVGGDVKGNPVTGGKTGPHCSWGI
jgi:hypothetical protein